MHRDHRWRSHPIVHHADLECKGEVTTLEGISKDGKLHPLQQAWIDEQVPACGYCQNGQIMTAKALLDKKRKPTDAQIRDAMARTLCRCMTYYRIQAAIKRVAPERWSHEHPTAQFVEDILECSRRASAQELLACVRPAGPDKQAAPHGGRSLSGSRFRNSIHGL